MVVRCQAVYSDDMSKGLKTIGDRVRFARTELREQRGQRPMPQRVVADHLGIAIPSVSEWERNTAQPSRDRMPDLAVVLGVDLLWLEYGIGLPDAGVNDKLKVIPLAVNGRLVPVVDPAIAADDEGLAISSSISKSYTSYQSGSRVYKLRVWNDSNSCPGSAISLAEGDDVTIDGSADCKPGDMVFAVTDERQPIIGMLYVDRSVGLAVEIRHQNPAYGAERLSSRD